MENYTDNRVLLKTSKDINFQDLEMIQLFFETYSFSGGDEVIAFNSLSNDTLEITYRCNSTKQNILKIKSFNYKNYDFQANEPVSENLHETLEPLKNSMILENIAKNEDIFNIALYSHYLVYNNIIRGIVLSDTYPDTFYVQFEREIDFKDLIQRHNKKTQLHGREVKVYERFETLLVLVKLKVDGKSKLEISEYLNLTFQNEMHWQSFDNFDKIPYVVLKFTNFFFKNEFLKECDKYIDNNFIVVFESVSNLNQLNYLLSLNDRSKIKIENIEDVKYPINTLKNSLSVIEQVNKETINTYVNLNGKISSGENRGRQKRYLCNLCPYKADRMSNIERHIKLHDKSLANKHKFKCNYCHYYVKLKPQQANHERVHRNKQQ